MAKKRHAAAAGIVTCLIGQVGQVWLNQKQHAATRLLDDRRRRGRELEVGRRPKERGEPRAERRGRLLLFPVAAAGAAAAPACGGASEPSARSTTVDPTAELPRARQASPLHRAGTRVAIGISA